MCIFLFPSFPRQKLQIFKNKEIQNETVKRNVKELCFTLFLTFVHAVCEVRATVRWPAPGWGSLVSATRPTLTRIQSGDRVVRVAGVHPRPQSCFVCVCICMSVVKRGEKCARVDSHLVVVWLGCSLGEEGCGR